MLKMLFPSAELLIFFFVNRFRNFTVAAALLMHHLSIKNSLEQLLLMSDECSLSFIGSDIQSCLVILYLGRSALLPSQLRWWREHSSLLFKHSEHEISIQHQFGLVLNKISIDDGGCHRVSSLFVLL